MRSVLCAVLVLMIGCSDDDDSNARDSGTRDASDRGGGSNADADRGGGGGGGATEPDSKSCQRMQFRESDVIVFERNAAFGVFPSVVPIEASASFAGVVTAHGDGFPMFDAPTDTVPADVADFRFVRIANEGRSWTLAARNLPDFAVRERAQVTLEVRSNPLRVNFPERWIVIREASALAFFFAQANELADLPSADGFTFEAGKRLCTLKNVCGDVGTFDLEVKLPTGSALTLKPNQTLERDGYKVTHRETRKVVSDGVSSCADYSPGSTQLIVSRTMLPEPAPFACKTTALSNFAGVRVEFPNDVPCSFTLQQAKAGIQIPYRIVVDNDVPKFAGDAPDIGGCLTPDAGKIAALAELSDNNQYYGVRDVGGCLGKLNVGTLHSGTYADVFKWDGVNWRGESDTGEPKGAAFPAGLYTLTITARGYTEVEDGADAGSGNPVRAVGTLGVLLRE